MGRKKSDKLWGQLEKIVESKPDRFASGQKYYVKLIGVDKPVWVLAKDLSKGVAKNYEADGCLVKGAKALVNRGFVMQQKTFLNNKVISFICLYSLRSLVHVLCLQEADKSPTADPVKLRKRIGGWVTVVQEFVMAMNKVLRSPVSKRCAAFDDMMTSLNPSKEVVKIMRKSDYLDGTLVVWRRKHNIFSPTEGKPVRLTCACCDTSHSFAR